MATNEEVKAFHQRNVSVGSKMAGGVVGALATLATHFPVAGPLIAPVIAYGLERLGNEMIQRHLAPRQDLRAGTAITIAVMRAKEFVEQGREPRSDGFFDKDDAERSHFDEINEAAVQAAMNSAQEKKVEYIGFLIANIAFNSSIDVYMGHQLIEMANSLGYRSFVLLKIIDNNISAGLENASSNNSDLGAAPLSSMMAECYGLFTRGLMEQKDAPESENSDAILGVDNILPNRMCLTPLGKVLVKNLEVGRIKDDDDVYLETMDLLARISTHERGSIIIDGGGVF